MKLTHWFSYIVISLLAGAALAQAVVDAIYREAGFLHDKI